MIDAVCMSSPAIQAKLLSSRQVTTHDAGATITTPRRVVATQFPGPHIATPRSPARLGKTVYRRQLGLSRHAPCKSGDFFTSNLTCHDMSRARASSQDSFMRRCRQYEKNFEQRSTGPAASDVLLSMTRYQSAMT
jgi:hypothetical protein